MDLMWKRVAKAIDPKGDGRYEVEYRIKQLDGSWRWLSAWGLVEFEGEGDEHKPVAIAGASRDLTERKVAEEVQHLLHAELNHRVKNTLAVVQSIAAQTLRDASDLETARKALDGRILSLSVTHDLLTKNNWTGAELGNVIARVTEPFGTERVNLSGPSKHVSPKHVLALSLAMHELATNAAKYGALSCPEGRVGIQWTIDGGKLNLIWQEKGGPIVVTPTRRGFGSRVLEVALLRDLQGDAQLNFLPAGVHWQMSAPL